MRRLIERAPDEHLTSRGDAFFTLARAIIGQQISVKAADSIWAKMEAGLEAITPERVWQADETVLRGFGLSGHKIRYLKEIAGHLHKNPHLAERWREAEDEALIKELTAIKGIGRWTAEMFLIFHLLKPDVFPIGDLGMLKSIYDHYNGGEKMELSQVLALAERWRPWRTVATWYLWRAKDPVIVGY